MKRLAVICLLLLLVLRPARVAAADGEERWAEVFAALDRALKAPKAPPLRCSDLFGAPFDLSALEGKVVILASVDRKSQDEAFRWLQGQPVFHLGRKDLAYVNLVFPGGIFFLVPRGEAVVRIRKMIDEATAGVTADLSPDDRRRFDGTEIHWIVDWKRDAMGRFGAFPGRVNLFVIDHEGRIVEVIRRLDDRAQAILHEAVRVALDRRKRAEEEKSASHERGDS